MKLLNVHVYCINYIRIKKLILKSSNEVFFNKKIDISKLKVFGCKEFLFLIDTNKENLKIIWKYNKKKKKRYFLRIFIWLSWLLCPGHYFKINNYSSWCILQWKYTRLTWYIFFFFFLFLKSFRKKNWRGIGIYNIILVNPFIIMN